MTAEPRANRRLGVFRRLTLIGPTGRSFLDRAGIDVRLFGLYVHRITGPDPGLDVHDHPWAFVSLVVRGGYTEVAGHARTPNRLEIRKWRAGSVHRIRQTEVHQIVQAEPGTVTFVFRGRKTRRWGFYTPAGFVDWEAYDFEARRPVTEKRS